MCLVLFQIPLTLPDFMHPNFPLTHWAFHDHYLTPPVLPEYMYPNFPLNHWAFLPCLHLNLPPSFRILPLSLEVFPSPSHPAPLPPSPSNPPSFLSQLIPYSCPSYSLYLLTVTLLHFLLFPVILLCFLTLSSIPLSLLTVTLLHFFTFKKN